MPNPEISDTVNTMPNAGEASSETSRQTYEARGEKANEQVYKDKLIAEYNEVLAKQAKIEGLMQQLAKEIEQEKQALANKTQTDDDSGEDIEEKPEEDIAAVESEQTIDEAKAKKSPGFKKAMKTVLISVAASVLLGGVIGFIASKTANNNHTSIPNRSGASDTANTDSTVGEDQEAKGIYDGYGEKGMWLSHNKGGQYDFTSAKEVAEVCDNDECEMIKYTSHNQVESYADYLANLPEELQPEGFKGLTILETEKKLEGLSKEKFESIKQQYEKIIDGAFTRDVILNGYYHNSYMRLIDPSKPVTHDNMELVECTTYENGTRAIELYWTDDGTANGKVIGTMTVKISRDDNGNVTGGCMQIVNPTDSNTHIYTGMDKITENPITPPEEPTTPPVETVKPKDSDNLVRIDQDILDQVAEEILTDQVNVTPNPGVNNDEQTSNPSPDSYQGTSPDIVQNDDSESAESVQDQVSPGNDYSQNRGGANEFEYSPVQDDQTAQAFADFNETPVSEVTVSGTDIQDILSDLGIN